jgi:hypothetical protein
MTLWRLRDDLRGQGIFTRHSYYIAAHARGTHTREILSVSKPVFPIVIGHDD